MIAILQQIQKVIVSPAKEYDLYNGITLHMSSLFKKLSSLMHQFKIQRIKSGNEEANSIIKDQIMENNDSSINKKFHNNIHNVSLFLV